MADKLPQRYMASPHGYTADKPTTGMQRPQVRLNAPFQAENSTSPERREFLMRRQIRDLLALRYRSVPSMSAETAR